MNPSSRTGRVTAPSTGTEHQMADAETDARPVDQDALVADIDRTRAELARTIDAIPDGVSRKKTGPGARGRARRRATQIAPLMAGAPAAAVLVSVTVIFLVRRRKR